MVVKSRGGSKDVGKGLEVHSLNPKVRKLYADAVCGDMCVGVLG